MPPDHQWVPGYWSQASRGYQYISGFWASTQVAELDYLPLPPESLEQGPSSPAPGDTHFYIPGNWVYDSNDYQWQPGYWSVNHESWVWIPAQYVWTPRGCVYQAGYWDYDIPDRGVVFTPVYYQQPVYRSEQYVYRPQYVVDTGPELFVHMFVRPNYGHYYYGDYYGSRYSNSYQSWSTYYQGPRYYDPFYTNYRVRGGASNNLNLLSWIASQHQVFVQNDRYRPATTIAAQRNLFNASRPANLDPTILRLANLGDSLDSLVLANNTNINFQQLNQSDVDRIVRTEAPLRALRNQRRQVESSQDANANAAMRVSLSEVRQQMEAAKVADASVQANTTADANINGRPGNRADNPERNSPGRDAVTEARQTGRDALLRPGQELDARGEDNAQRPKLGRDSKQKLDRSTPGVGTPGAGLPDRGIPGVGTPGRNTPATGTLGAGTPATVTPATVTPGVGTPGVGTPGVGIPDRNTTELGPWDRQSPSSRDLQNRRDNPSAQPLGNLTPGDIDLRNRQGAALQDRNSDGQRPGVVDRDNRALLEFNQRQNQSSTQGSSQRPNPNSSALEATGNSQRLAWEPATREARSRCVLPDRKIGRPPLDTNWAGACPRSLGASRCNPSTNRPAVARHRSVAKPQIRAERAKERARRKTISVWPRLSAPNSFCRSSSYDASSGVGHRGCVRSKASTV